MKKTSPFTGSEHIEMLELLSEIRDHFPRCRIFPCDPVTKVAFGWQNNFREFVDKIHFPEGHKPGIVPGDICRVAIDIDCKELEIKTGIHNDPNAINCEVKDVKKQSTENGKKVVKKIKETHLTYSKEYCINHRNEGINRSLDHFGKDVKRIQIDSAAQGSHGCHIIMRADASLNKLSNIPRKKRESLQFTWSHGETRHADGYIAIHSIESLRKIVEDIKDQEGVGISLDKYMSFPIRYPAPESTLISSQKTKKQKEIWQDLPSNTDPDDNQDLIKKRHLPGMEGFLESKYNKKIEEIERVSNSQEFLKLCMAACGYGIELYGLEGVCKDLEKAVKKSDTYAKHGDDCINTINSQVRRYATDPNFDPMQPLIGVCGNKGDAWPTSQSQTKEQISYTKAQIDAIKSSLKIMKERDEHNSVIKDHEEEKTKIRERLESHIKDNAEEIIKANTELEGFKSMGDAQWIKIKIAGKKSTISRLESKEKRLRSDAEDKIAKEDKKINKSKKLIERLEIPDAFKELSTSKLKIKLESIKKDLKVLENRESKQSENQIGQVDAISLLNKIKDTSKVSYLQLSPDQAKALSAEIIEARIEGYGLNPRMNELKDEVYVDPKWTSSSSGQLTDITSIMLSKLIAQNTVAILGRQGHTHIKLPKESITDAIKLAAYQEKYNPLADWISECLIKSRPLKKKILNEFDPIDHMHEMFIFLNLKDVKELIPWLSMFLPYSVLQRSIISPGCEINHFPCLLSMGKLKGEKQGKTSWSKTFLPNNRQCREMFTEDFDLRIKGESRTRMLRHNIIIELGEMSGVYKATFESVKTLLTNCKDDSRNLYENHMTGRPRRNTFVMTCNSSDWLTADQENRRFQVFEVSRGPKSPLECYNSKWKGTNLTVREAWFIYAALKLEEAKKVKWDKNGMANIGENPSGLYEPMFGDLDDSLRHKGAKNTTYYARSNTEIENALVKCLPELKHYAKDLTKKGNFIPSKILRAKLAATLTDIDEEGYRNTNKDEDGVSRELFPKRQVSTRDGIIEVESGEKERSIDRKIVEFQKSTKSWNEVIHACAKLGVEKQNPPERVDGLACKGFIYTSQYNLPDVDPPKIAEEIVDKDGTRWRDNASGNINENGDYQ